jgi:hypothetical protein
VRVIARMVARRRAAVISCTDRFISKFFVVNHAHGELLHGVVEGLPRSEFEVFLFNIANPREPLNEPLMAVADHVRAN